MQKMRAKIFIALLFAVTIFALTFSGCQHAGIGYVIEQKPDSVIFQESLDKFPSWGGTLYVRTGHYKFLKSVTRKIDNVKVIGEGEVEFECTGDFPLFVVGGNGWQFENFRTNKGIEFGKFTGYVIKNVTIGTTYYKESVE